MSPNQCHRCQQGHCSSTHYNAEGEGTFGTRAVSGQQLVGGGRRLRDLRNSVLFRIPAQTSSDSICALNVTNTNHFSRSVVVADDIRGRRRLGVVARRRVLLGASHAASCQRTPKERLRRTHFSGQPLAKCCCCPNDA